MAAPLFSTASFTSTWSILNAGGIGCFDAFSMCQVTNKGLAWPIVCWGLKRPLSITSMWMVLSTSTWWLTSTNMDVAKHSHLWPPENLIQASVSCRSTKNNDDLRPSMQVNFLLPQKNAIHHLLLGPSANQADPSDGLSAHKKHRFETCSGAAESQTKLLL